jgi:hypothetical protein
MATVTRTCVPFGIDIARWLGADRMTFAPWSDKRRWLGRREPEQEPPQQETVPGPTYENPNEDETYGEQPAPEPDEDDEY